MLIRQTDFDKRRNSSTLRLALVGMSNIGKSYAAHRISQHKEFKKIEIDTLIQKQLGLPGMTDIASWMGFPWQEGYEENARSYLDAEEHLTLADYGVGNLVLDTTGSVIHLPKKSVISIKNKYLCVYLKANSKDRHRLKRTYFKHPKPTIWGVHYHKQTGQTEKASLMACYPELLSARERLYEDLADITLSAHTCLKLCRSDGDILELIRDKLPD